MLKEDLETAVLYSNICLQRWAANKTHLLNTESVRSMINGWLIKVLCRTSHIEWRMRKSLAKNISRSLFVTVDDKNYYITSITVKDFVIPLLDYVSLYEKAKKLINESNFPTDLKSFNLKSIESIKFN